VAGKRPVGDAVQVRYDAGIFDLGGVLIDWNPRHLYRKLFAGDDEAMERFLADVCTPAWNRELDRGRPFQEAIDELAGEHPHEAPLIHAYWDRWSEMLGGLDREVLAILDQLHARGLRLYALSNWSAQTYGATRHLVPELDLFDGVLISGEAGHVKPEPEIFTAAIARFGVEPERAFFVDDIAANVAAARVLGMTALQFSGAAALRRDLAAIGVLPREF
jgi:2-haloacid dehalogenase